MKFHNSLQEAVVADGQNVQVGSSVGIGQTFQSVEAGQAGAQGTMVVFNMATLNPLAGYDAGNYRFGTTGQEGLKPHVHAWLGNRYTVFWLDEPPQKAEKERGSMTDDERNEAWRHVCANRETFIEQYQKHYPRPDRPKQEPKQKQSKTQKKKEQANAKEKKRHRG